MKTFLALAAGIDRLTDSTAWFARWAVIAACFISAGNAIVRYGFDWSSNALLEVQWYLFAACVMFGAAKVLRLNEHVRVDVLYTHYPTRAKVVFDLLGLLFLLLPSVALMAWWSWPLFHGQWVSGEMSSQSGGLIRWPVTLTVPLGLGLVALQGVSEAIKRIGWLAGAHDMDTHYERPLQ